MILRKCTWCDDAESGLLGAFGELKPHELAQMVDAGTCELWRVNDDSWLVTGIEKDDAGRLLFVWSFAGRDLLNVSKGILRIAKHNGLSRVQFVCFKTSVARLLKKLAPKLVTITRDGARLYEIGVS